MARTTPGLSPRVAEATAARARKLSAVLGAGVAAAVGAGLALLVVLGSAQVGDGPLELHQLLALHGPEYRGGSAAAAAAESGSQLLRFGVLACSAAAAVLLLLGGWHSVASRQSRRIGGRLQLTGLWLALAVSVLAALPLGAPVLVADLAMGVPWLPDAAAQWQPAIPELLAVGAGAGLILAAVSGNHRRGRGSG